MVISNLLVNGRTHTVTGDSFAVLPRAQLPIRTDLLKPSVLLHQWREPTGAAGWRGLHIIVAEAAEEGAEDAAASLLL